MLQLRHSLNKLLILTHFTQVVNIFLRQCQYIDTHAYCYYYYYYYYYYCDMNTTTYRRSVKRNY